MHLGSARARLLLPVAAAGLVASGLVAPAPAYAEELERTVACEEIETTGTEDVYLTDRPNVPLEAMGIPELHERMGGEERVGLGVRVAVLDSGVDPRSTLMTVIPGQSFTATTAMQDYHGTAVAGLIAGRSRDGELTGVAPGAQIVDVRVYDDDQPDDPQYVAPIASTVALGLDWVAANARRLQIGVAVVALRLDDDRRVEQAIKRLHRQQDVVVVAAAGNRPFDDTDPLRDEYGALKSGEDARDVVFPAGYVDDVVAVNATVGGHPEATAGLDARDFVLQNTATDVAAPTYGAVTAGLNGSSCLLENIATSWATAEVAGVVAALRSAYPKEDADQIVARLKQTASGSPQDANPLVGAGVVQPVDALTRRLTPGKQGQLGEYPDAESTIPPATAPEPEPDVLAPAREDAVWWGLVGGGVVVLALLLRPLLARRR